MFGLLHFSVQSAVQTISQRQLPTCRRLSHSIVPTLHSATTTPHPTSSLHPANCNAAYSTLHTALALFNLVLIQPHPEGACYNRICQSLTTHSLPMSASTEPPYAVGDTILVEQGSKLHAAKVLQLGDGQVAGQDVFVHYLGWNKKWDSWAKLEHTRPITADSRAEQARMVEEFEQKQNKSSKKQKSREEAGIGTATAARALL